MEIYSHCSHDLIAPTTFHHFGGIVCKACCTPIHQLTLWRFTRIIFNPHLQARSWTPTAQSKLKRYATNTSCTHRLPCSCRTRPLPGSFFYGTLFAAFAVTSGPQGASSGLPAHTEAQGKWGSQMGQMGKVQGAGWSRLPVGGLDGCCILTGNSCTWPRTADKKRSAWSRSSGHVGRSLLLAARSFLVAGTCPRFTICFRDS